MLLKYHEVYMFALVHVFWDERGAFSLVLYAQQRQAVIKRDLIREDSVGGRGASGLARHVQKYPFL